MPPEVYTLDPGEHEWEALLRPWDWRLPEAYAVRLANRYGDVFLEVPGAGVMALDIGQGTLEPVAASLEEFERGLEDPEKAAMWLMIPLVDQLVASGSRPGPGQCYSFARPPSAGATTRPKTPPWSMSPRTSPSTPISSGPCGGIPTGRWCTSFSTADGSPKSIRGWPPKVAKSGP